MARLSTLLVSCLVAGASAFTPASQGVQTTSLSAKPINQEIGVQAPVGFFDPLGFIKNGPYGSPEENFRHYRGVEVKHGRIAMAATLGMLVQETTRFQGYLSPSANLKFDDVPNGLGALDAVPLEGWVQMAVVIGMHEVFIKEREGRAPGDFGTGYFGFSLDDQSSKQIRALSVEVSNGRLAMLGILGMFASEIVNGKPLAEVAGF